jgi:hypothetical protein
VDAQLGEGVLHAIDNGDEGLHALITRHDDAAAVLLPNPQQ